MSSRRGSGGPSPRLIVTRCVFDRNKNLGSKVRGGALRIEAGNVVVVEESEFRLNTVHSNAQDAFGGAIALYETTAMSNVMSSLDVRGCIFDGNVAATSDVTSGGGAIFMGTTNVPSNLTIVKSVFRGNLAERAGGAIATVRSTVVVMADVLFEANSVRDGVGGAVSCAGPAAHLNG